MAGASEFLLAGAAIVILVVFAGLKSVAMLAVGVAAAAVSLWGARSLHDL